MHALALRAIAKEEPVIQTADGLARSRRAENGTIPGGFLAGWLAGHIGVSRGGTAQTDVVVAPIARLTLDVEARAVPANEFEFTHQRTEFVGGGFTDDGASLPEDSSRLAIAALDPKVAEQAVTEALGF